MAEIGFMPESLSSKPKPYQENMRLVPFVYMNDGSHVVIMGTKVMRN